MQRELEELKKVKENIDFDTHSHKKKFEEWKDLSDKVELLKKDPFWQLLTEIEAFRVLTETP